MAKGTPSEVIAAALAGQVVSFPTDTVPALATLPPYANLIYATKKRAQDKPLILMGASCKQLWSYVQGTPRELNIWQKVALKYLPGALTLVLPASSEVPLVMNPTNPTTIGIRVPDHKIAQAILTKTGPLATTSANLSGEPPIMSLNAIADVFPSVLTLNDDSYIGSGMPSTVAKWTGEGWEILRQGSITLSNNEINNDE
jgi:L-threonylcarbamoyladenylate synthase